METSAYDRVPLRVPMKPSPSATYNNLTLAGQSLFYAHTTQACTLQPAGATAGTPINVRRIECQCVDFVHTVRALPHGETGFLLLATEGGVQIWDKLAHHLLFVWQFPDVPKNDSGGPQSVDAAAAAAAGEGVRHQQFARGAAIVVAVDGTANICFGTSSGTLYVLKVDDTGRMEGPHAFEHHKAPVTAISSAYQARQGRWTDDLDAYLVTADESGCIAVWQADSFKSYTVVGTLGDADVPAVSLAVRNGFVIAARLDGNVHVYGIRDRTLRAEICAHSRWLSCMDIHPTKNLIVTGAEDGTIAVWSLPIGAQKTAALLSVTWMHAAVAGVVFCGPTLDDVAAVAFDTDELQIYKTNKPT